MEFCYIMSPLFCYNRQADKSIFRNTHNRTSCYRQSTFRNTQLDILQQTVNIPLHTTGHPDTDSQHSATYNWTSCYRQSTFRYIQLDILLQTANNLQHKTGHPATHIAQHSAIHNRTSCHTSATQY